MYAEWVAAEHHRLHVVEEWPESPHKKVALAAIQSSLYSLLQNHPPEAVPPVRIWSRQGHRLRQGAGSFSVTRYYSNSTSNCPDANITCPGPAQDPGTGISRGSGGKDVVYQHDACSSQRGIIPQSKRSADIGTALFAAQSGLGFGGNDPPKATGV